MADEGTFTWINKDASNIDSKEHITISTSHAQAVTWSLRQQKSTSCLKKFGGLSSDRRLACRKRNQALESKERSKAEIGRTPAATQLPDRAAYMPSNPTSDSILNEQLDPFISLATKTTYHERNLLHYYLIVTPGRVYGTHKTSLFCPVRDRTSVFVQQSNDWLQGVILSAEVDILGARAADESTSVLSRRASIYRSIREELSNPKTRYSDAAITRITMIAVAEHRIGCSLADAQRHLGIVKQLVNDRGDRWKRMPFTIVATFIWLGSGFAAFPDCNVLETAISCFVQGLSMFPERKIIEVPTGEDLMASCDDEDPRKIYQQLLRKVFGPASSLRPFFQAQIHDQITAHYRSYLAILWILNRILFDLRHDFSKSISFLTRLNYLMDPRHQTHLKGMAALFIVMDCLARLGVPQNEQDHNVTDLILCRGCEDRRIVWWWEAVDAVEIMLFLKGESRQKVLDLLFTSLDGGGSCGGPNLGTSLMNVADEVRLGWMVGRSNR